LYICVLKYCSTSCCLYDTFMDPWNVHMRVCTVHKFMFCWPCITIYACNETNLMHCLSSIYSVTIPVNVSGLLAAHHQEVTMYICNNWYMLYNLVDCWLAWLNKLKINSTSGWFHYRHMYHVRKLRVLSFTDNPILNNKNRLTAIKNTTL
jgi:hypothetical protein